MDSLLFPHFCTGKNATNLGEVPGTFLISRKIVRGVDSERPRSIQSEREVFFAVLKKKKPISQVVAPAASAFPHTCEKEKILFFPFFEKSCHHFSSVRASHSNKQKSAYFFVLPPCGKRG